jgi:hypothetical protein
MILKKIAQNAEKVCCFANFYATMSAYQGKGTSVNGKYPVFAAKLPPV